MTATQQIHYVPEPHPQGQVRPQGEGAGPEGLAPRAEQLYDDYLAERRKEMGE